MRKKKIGSVVINFNEAGEVTESRFEPKFVHYVSPDLMSDINKAPAARTQQELKEFSDGVLASWFSEATNIELADRNEYQVRSVCSRCIRHLNGIIKLCVIDYFLEPVKAA